MAGVRAPDIEHQKRMLYPLQHAPPGRWICPIWIPMTTLISSQGDITLFLTQPTQFTLASLSKFVSAVNSYPLMTQIPPSGFALSLGLVSIPAGTDMFRRDVPEESR